MPAGGCAKELEELKPRGFPSGWGGSRPGPASSWGRITFRRAHHRADGRSLRIAPILCMFHVPCDRNMNASEKNSASEHTYKLIHLASCTEVTRSGLTSRA